MADWPTRLFVFIEFALGAVGMLILLSLWRGSERHRR
jgi:hypothetical protein